MDSYLRADMIEQMIDDLCYKDILDYDLKWNYDLEYEIMNI